MMLRFTRAAVMVAEHAHEDHCGQCNGRGAGHREVRTRTFCCGQQRCLRTFKPLGRAAASVENPLRSAGDACLKRPEPADRSTKERDENEDTSCRNDRRSDQDSRTCRTPRRLPGRVTARASNRRSP
jgi:hypothetical protein